MGNIVHLYERSKEPMNGPTIQQNWKEVVDMCYFKIGNGVAVAFQSLFLRDVEYNGSWLHARTAVTT